VLSGTPSPVAALIKQRHPLWSPAMIMSAIMTHADATDHSGRPLMARWDSHDTEPATSFDMGFGASNAVRALDLGRVFDAGFSDYLQLLWAVPGVDDAAVWCSDLNAPSVTVSSLVGLRLVTSVGAQNEMYTACPCAW
jgi:hypothetical protein